MRKALAPTEYRSVFGIARKQSNFIPYNAKKMQLRDKSDYLAAQEVNKWLHWALSQPISYWRAK